MITSKRRLEDVYEPFLLQQGFLGRTPRGRALVIGTSLDLAAALCLAAQHVARQLEADGDELVRREIEAAGGHRR